MKYDLNKNNWSFDDRISVSEKDGKLIYENKTNDKITIVYNSSIAIKNEELSEIYIKYKGETTNSGGYITINDNYSFPIGGEITMPLKVPTILKFALTIAARSSIELHNIEISSGKNINLVDELDSNNEVLIIVPDYPSYVNLYSCAFAHSRNKEYIKNGIKIQVFAVNPYIWFQTKYCKDEVPVIRGTYENLKDLLSKKHYKTIVAHFVDEYLYPIFDGNVYNNQKLIFICHGPETVYKYLVNKTRPYFTAPCKEPINNSLFDLKDYYVHKYAEKDNVEWVFVSDWLKEFSEEQQKIKFKHSRVINNIIDEDLFPYTKRDAEKRKKILMVRKFDNICQHSIDQVVFAILELSRRKIFKDLEFDIYGDGNFYDELVEPIRNFKNVNLIRSFIPNEKLNDIYKEHGIMLLPSRHDAHAVSMGESASTGLVVLGSNVTSNPYFMNVEENHTLTDPEDFVGLADIIERLYNNPKEFLKISENMANFTRQFKKENTVLKEVELIKKSLKSYSDKITFTKREKEEPILTIGIPAYNVENYIEKCLVSILNSRNAGKIEVLVINDGSTDKTSEIVEKYVNLSNGIVKLINKENGGHGSTINVAIKEAHGKYFRLIDGDDWVDSENLSRLVDIMEAEDSDIILTKGSYDYKDQALLVDIIKYDNLLEGKHYNFEDLTYDHYGFSKYGPLLTTGNYKTSLLRKANFTISEKKPYVDMEFNAFSIKYMNTIVLYNLDIYRYLIGREGQTISREYWKKKYKDHEYIIFNILDKVMSDEDYTLRKKEYVLKNIIASMVDSQIFMFDTIIKYDELENFLEKLKQYPEAYETSIKYIEKLNGNCWLILNYYKKHMKVHANESIIIPGVRETVNDIIPKHTVKRIIKAIIPYGLLVSIRNKREK